MLTLALILLITSTASIGVPIHEGPRCMIIQGEFDPLKLELKLPVIPNKRQGQKFRVTLIQLLEDQIVFDVLLEEKTLYRKNLELPYNKMYHLCLQVHTDRNFFDPVKQKMYVEYIVNQNFDALIGNFEIPPELVGEKNLQYIYNMSQSIKNLNKKIVQNQIREREIEQNMAKTNLDKNKRISMFTIIQCFVIVISGLYQVLALRRFLIEKNLY